jgi:hypothetical protein
MPGDNTAVDRIVFRSRTGIVLLVALTALGIGATLSAGIRGAGSYNGVVLYDRWDNCYLFSGVYLMYISDLAKEALRPFRGRSMEIDAKEVVQPMNPGDGLITKLTVVGESRENHRTPPISGIDLRASVTKASGHVKATTEIRNGSPSDISIDPAAFGFAVIAHDKPSKPFFLCPSEGTSCAVITRVAGTSPNGKNSINKRAWSWTFPRSDRILTRFTLHSGEVRRTSVIFGLPNGEYQFIAGYGGGVHAGPVTASNLVDFEVLR